MNGFLLLAIVSSMLAVATVFHSWKNKGRPVLAFAGWLFACLSMIPWSLALGTEFGIVYALMVFIGLVWLQVGATADLGQGPGNAQARVHRPLAFPSPRSLGRHLGLFLLAVPAAGLVSLALSVVLVLFLPWTTLYKVTTAIFIMPVIWGGLSAWLCASERLLVPAAVTGGLFSVSCLLLLV